MKKDILKFFTLQRQIFGLCPRSGEFFRLTDCQLFVKTKPVRDWMDKIEIESQRLDRADEKLDEKEEELREKARKKGRRLAQKAARRIDLVFTPRKLNPDGAKVVFHPIDYIVFDGMSDGASIKNVMLLDRQVKGAEQRTIQRSIERVIEREDYEWQTLRVLDDGSLKAE